MNNQRLASVHLFHCLDKQKVSFVSRSTNNFHKAPTAETWFFAYNLCYFSKTKQKPAGKMFIYWNEVYMLNFSYFLANQKTTKNRSRPVPFNCFSDWRIAPFFAALQLQSVKQGSVVFICLYSDKSKLYLSTSTVCVQGNTITQQKQQDHCNIIMTWFYWACHII